jgi:hypothetical protein
MTSTPIVEKEESTAGCSSLKKKPAEPVDETA